MDTHLTTTTVAKHLTYIPAIFLGLSMESYLILAILMIIDTIFGVIRVGVIYGGRHIMSHKLKAGIIKKATVIVVPMILAMAGKGAGIDLLPVAKSILGILILSETYSIIGSVYAIRIKKDVPEWDMVSIALRQVQKQIERFLKLDPSNQPTDKELIDKK
jgi:small basic protein